MSRPDAYGMGPPPPRATDATFLDVRGRRFRASSVIIGLFPESILMEIFPNGVVPLWSLITGRETSNAIQATKNGAMEHAQMQGQLIAHKKKSKAREHAGLLLPTYCSDPVAYEFEDHPMDHPDISPVEWYKQHPMFVNGEPFDPAKFSIAHDLDGVEEWKIFRVDWDPDYFSYLLSYFRQIVTDNEEILMRKEEEPVEAEQAVSQGASIRGIAESQHIPAVGGNESLTTETHTHMVEPELSATPAPASQPEFGPQWHEGLAGEPTLEPLDQPMPAPPSPVESCPSVIIDIPDDIDLPTLPDIVVSPPSVEDQYQIVPQSELVQISPPTVENPYQTVPQPAEPIALDKAPSVEEESTYETAATGPPSRIPTPALPGQSSEGSTEGAPTPAGNIPAESAAKAPGSGMLSGKTPRRRSNPFKTTFSSMRSSLVKLIGKSSSKPNLARAPSPMTAQPDGTVQNGKGWISDVIVLREEMEIYPLISSSVDESEPTGGKGLKSAWKRFSGDVGPARTATDFRKVPGLLKHIRAEIADNLKDQRFIDKPYAERGWDLFQASELVRNGPDVVRLSGVTPESPHQTEPTSPNASALSLPTYHCDLNYHTSGFLKNSTSPFTLSSPPKWPRTMMVCELEDQLMHPHLLEGMKTFSPEMEGKGDVMPGGGVREWDFRTTDGKGKVSSVVMLKTKDWDEIGKKIAELEAAQEAAAQGNANEQAAAARPSEPVIDVVEDAKDGSSSRRKSKGKGKDKSKKRGSWLGLAGRNSKTEAVAAPAESNNSSAGKVHNDETKIPKESNVQAGAANDVQQQQQQPTDANPQNSTSGDVSNGADEESIDEYQQSLEQQPEPQPQPEPPVKGAIVHPTLEAVMTPEQAKATSMRHLHTHLLYKRPVRKCWWECVKMAIDVPGSLMGADAEKRKSTGTPTSGTSPTNDTEGDGRGSGYGVSAAELPFEPAGPSDDLDSITPAPLGGPPADEVRPAGGEVEKEGGGRKSMGFKSTSMKRKLGLGADGKDGKEDKPAGKVWVKVWTRRTWTIEFCSF
ncbi:hypothetical protein HK097_002945 [Rhizophlyctis rosea]|uniref:Uncharacterized protein n=1 Tax=Rhizophlyctis rosea TaxID=64517 RepID=A0AAD5X7M7_9FUNG|nr:hypothetical protein HK097_002945 [Rhizophlyctis rosea]